MKEKIKELLGLNIPANVVASAVGCDPSYPAQLMAEEEFAAEVITLRIAATAAHAARDKKYDSIEDSLVGKLEEMLDSGGLYFTKPIEVLAAIKVINSAKRRTSTAELAGNTTNNSYINLQLPENSEFAARFVLNSQNQVVEIAGRSLATMSAKGVLTKMEELAKNRVSPTPRHVLEHQKDQDEAQSRLDGLVKLEHLDVASTL